MNWKFWKKDKTTSVEVFIDSKEIPSSTLFRWFLYDSGVDVPNKIASAAGYTPVSDEGDELERRESRERLRRVRPFESFIDMLSSITGQVLAETLDNLLDDSESSFNDLTEEQQETQKQIMTILYTKVAEVALIPAFAAALELGLVVNPGTFTGELEGDYNEF